MAGWRLVVAVFVLSGHVLCVPVDQITAATVITEPDISVVSPGREGDVSSNGVRRRNGVELTEKDSGMPTSRERLVMQSLGLRCTGGDMLSCFMVELTDYFDGFMARSNVDLYPGGNATQGEEASAGAGPRSGEDPGGASLLQALGRKAWALARGYVLSLDLRPVAEFVQEVRTRGLLHGLEKALAAGRSEKLTGGGIELPIGALGSFGGGSSDSGNDDDDDDDDDDNDKDNSTRTTMTAIVLKTVVWGVLALKVMAVLIAKVAVIMKVTAAVAVLALLFFHGFQKDISYQVVTHQKQPDSYEPDPHSHQEEYGGDSYSNAGGGGGGGGYGAGNGGGGGGGGGGDWGRNGAAHNMAYRAQRRKQNG